MPVGDRLSRQLFYLEIIPSSQLNRRGGGESDILTFSGIPTDVTLSKSASYNDEHILGRSEPYKTYSHSGATQISFTAPLIAQGEISSTGRALQSFLASQTARSASQFFPEASPFLGISGNILANLTGRGVDEQRRLTAIIDDVHKKVAWLEALQYTQYDASGRAYPPPMVRLRYGDNLGLNGRTGVMTSFSAQYDGPWHTTTLLTYQAQVSLTLSEVNAVPKSYSDARARYGARAGAADAADARNQRGLTAELSLDIARSTLGL